MLDPGVTPAWMIALTGAIGAIAGSFFKPLFGLIESRETRAWKLQEQRIERLEEENRRLAERVSELTRLIQEARMIHEVDRTRLVQKYESEISHLHIEKHDAQNTANGAMLHAVNAMHRTNELLAAAGKPAEFDVGDFCARYSGRAPGAIDLPKRTSQAPASEDKARRQSGRAGQS